MARSMGGPCKKSYRTAPDDRSLATFCHSSDDSKLASLWSLRLLLEQMWLDGLKGSGRCIPGV